MIIKSRKSRLQISWCDLFGFFWTVFIVLSNYSHIIKIRFPQAIPLLSAEQIGYYMFCVLAIQSVHERKRLKRLVIILRSTQLLVQNRIACTLFSIASWLPASMHVYLWWWKISKYLLSDWGESHLSGGGY